MAHSAPAIAMATAFTALVIALGYILLGVVPMLLFALGFASGLIVWLLRTQPVAFATIKAPYFVTMGLFVVHKIEEREMDFFPALAELTGVPVPSLDSPLAIALYAAASCWLLVPWLVGRGIDVGQFLAWSLFVSMGVIELAHFAFPLLKAEPYGYFPGMASVLLLAPAGWWGMRRMWTAT